MSKESNNVARIIAPITGDVVALDKVPDPVFSDKILGDGVAILPADGKIYSPVDGEISSIAETKHAYGFRSNDGLDILIHFGLETVALKGEGFTPKVGVGDKVKVGDLVAEVDVELLKSKDINLITPVLICDGADGKEMNFATGKVEAGKNTLISLAEVKEPEKKESSKVVKTEDKVNEKPAVKEEKPVEKKKKGLNFEFLQKFGKTLMVVIAVMPAAGLAISVGKVVEMCAGDATVVFNIGNLIEQIGWVIINNLNLLFAVAIGGSWAKERAGGAFAALMSFILINMATGNIFGVTADMVADKSAVVYSIFGQEMNVHNYFTTILGLPALNMGVFVGIICGFLGATIYNKYYNFRKLPEALSFFNGKRFVPLVTIFYALITSVVIVIVWPIVQGGINAFGVWVANSAETAPVVAPFIYGTLERLLLPFGLHHMLTIPMNYTEFGGTYVVMTGVNAGTEVYGQEPLWLAWITDLINAKDAGDMATYNNLVTNVLPSRFKSGQIIGSTGLLIGIVCAMYRRIDVPAEKRRRYRSMFMSVGVATFLTGVTEPIEFMFMFCAVPLYVVYAVLQGCAFAMADVVRLISGGALNLRLQGLGIIELSSKIPLFVKGGIWSDLIVFVVLAVIFFAIGFVVAYAMIGKMRIATPGRLGNYVSTDSNDDAEDVSHGSGSGNAKDSGDSQPERIIALLGGRENIDFVDACMTRLRVTVKDPDKVADIAAWKKEGALNLLKKGTGIQAVYGPKADVLKSDINDIL